MSVIEIYTHLKAFHWWAPLIARTSTIDTAVFSIIYIIRISTHFRVCAVAIAARTQIWTPSIVFFTRFRPTALCKVIFWSLTLWFRKSICFIISKVQRAIEAGWFPSRWTIGSF